MSRFQNNFEKNGKTFELAWGYDRPLSEYFIQLYDVNPSDDDYEDEDDLTPIKKPSMMKKKAEVEEIDV